MARIEIKDLPKNKKIKQEEMRLIQGGGRYGFGGLGFLANPWVLAGIVAAAIAIPLAVAHDDDEGS